MKEAIVAVENIMGNDEKMRNEAIPNCVYTSPEIATVGLTQEEAEAKGIEISVGRFNFAANGKSHIHGRSRRVC